MRVNPGTILLILSTVCLPVATVSAQDPKPWTRAPTVRAPPRAAAQPAPLPKATITRVGVGGPVTGGQNSFGLVELSEPAPAAGVTIQLSSDNPAIVVPATVTVAPGASDQSFPVTTAPVASSTTVTVSAKIGAAAAPQTATVTVVPPALSMVICDPQTVPAGTSTTCKVQLNAPVATPSLGPERDSRVQQRGPAQIALTIQLASGNTGVATVPATVQIGAGQRSKSFKVGTKALAQSASSQISASYGGATKATTVYVQPASLESVTCGNSSASTCEYVPDYDTHSAFWFPGIMGRVKLTAPAPAGGLVVKLSDSPNLVQFWKFPEGAGGGKMVEVGAIRVPEGESRAHFEIVAKDGLAVDTRVTVSASAPLTGDSRTVMIVLKAPTVRVLSFDDVGNPATISGVPIGGRKVRMYVALIGGAPRQGWPLDLKYTGTTDISGPALVTIPWRWHYRYFDVTVGPCSVNPVCEVIASTGSLSAKLTVKP